MAMEEYFEEFVEGFRVSYATVIEEEELIAGTRLDALGTLTLDIEKERRHFFATYPMKEYMGLMQLLTTLSFSSRTGKCFELCRGN